MFEVIKNFPNESGIYKITSPTGKIYIGESINLKNRCGYYLNPNRVKKQTAIYNSLIKHSVESHIIEIIELCDISELKIKERYYQEKFNSVETGLNCFYTATNEKKKKHSENTKKLMSEKSSGENNPFFGKTHSIESLKKISESSKGINNANYGGKLITDEYIKKQIESNSKKHLKVTDTQTGEILFFKNSKECALALNAKASNVRMCKNNYKLKRRYIIEDDERIMPGV